MATHIGPYALSEHQIPVLLAPMSGVTDAPFRKQAARFGVSAAITEMVAGEELSQGHREAVQRMARHEGAHPFVVQLIGREADSMRRGAVLAREAGADIIDINMGCPSRRVTGGLSGSALMKDIDHAISLVQAVLTGAENVPVTLKMRLGWDRNSMNAPELAARAQELGVTLITVHGRTRQDFYEGDADWDAIKSVTDAVSIPVIANGDIGSVKAAKMALQKSGAAGLMIGRAATGRAWLPSSIERALHTGRPMTEPSLNDQINSLLEQAKDSVDFYGSRVGMKMIRKHLAAAFDHWLSSETFSRNGTFQDLKQEACQADDFIGLRRVFSQMISDELEMAG